MNLWANTSQARNEPLVSKTSFKNSCCFKQRKLGDKGLASILMEELYHSDWERMIDIEWGLDCDTFTMSWSNVGSLRIKLKNKQLVQY